MQLILRDRLCVRVVAGAAAVGLLVAGCGGDEDADPPATTMATVTTTTGPEVTATTGAGATTTTAAGPDLVRCSNAEGFSIAYPDSWAEAGCSQFHPEPFEPPGATDERVAAITAYVDPVPYAVATVPESARDVERTDLTIDGRPAVRLAYEFGDDAFYPSGTPITIYVVELAPGADGRPRTLFVDTVGLRTFSYERNVETLDRMAPTVELTG